MPINGLGFSGGGFSGGGFGRAPGEAVQLLGDAGGAGAPPSTQAAGVAQFGNVWASNRCSSCNTAILEMQNQINRAAAAFGVPIRLTLDGKVGAQTVGALQGVAQAVMGRYATVGLALRDYATTAETVAKNADTIRDKVKQVADAAGVPPVAAAIAATAPALPAASTIPMPTTVAPPGSFDIATMPAAGLPLAPVSKWRARAPYIIGGVLVAAGLGVATYILTRPTTPVQGADDDNDEE